MTELLESTLADSETVDQLFELILGRKINNDKFKADMHNSGSINYWVKRLINSEEFRNKFLQKHNASMDSPAFIPDSEFRTPRIFANTLPTKIIISGSCMAEEWVRQISSLFPGLKIRFSITNHASDLEDIEEGELSSYEFQIAQIPLRSVLNESLFMQTASEAGRAQDFSALLDRIKLAIDQNIHATLKYHRQCSIPVFVMNFVVPQINPMGLLIPRYLGMDFTYLISKMNEHISERIRDEQGVYVLDYDGICSTIGKRYISDELTSHITHGSVIGNSYGAADSSLTPYGSLFEAYRPKIKEAAMALIFECSALHYIHSPKRKIKLVIFDLDGTLWRGVPAELDEIDSGALTEGWPLSILEAAFFLKQRGILLAIASKNDPDTAVKVWDKVYGKRFPLTNFVSVKISWESKVNSISEILSETNLLADNCLFVDDNPVEREQVKNAFPGISILNEPILNWRRTLLWSAELQVPSITAESINRTQSVQNVIRRDRFRATLGPSDHIDSLEVKAQIDLVSGLGDRRFARTYELLNKTNQFNTTGRRWTESDLGEYLSTGGKVSIATVSDRFSDYGLTAIALHRAHVCDQLVMSCRIFGLRVEHTLLQHIFQALPDNAEVQIAFRRTEKNGPSEKFLSSIGVSLERARTDKIEILHIPKMFFPPRRP